MQLQQHQYKQQHKRSGCRSAQLQHLRARFIVIIKEFSPLGPQWTRLRSFKTKNKNKI